MNVSLTSSPSWAKVSQKSSSFSTPCSINFCFSNRPPFLILFTCGKLSVILVIFAVTFRKLIGPAHHPRGYKKAVNTKTAAKLHIQSPELIIMDELAKKAVTKHSGSYKVAKIYSIFIYRLLWLQKSSKTSVSWWKNGEPYNRSYSLAHTRPPPPPPVETS